MGWSNPPIPWRELERRLSAAPRRRPPGTPPEEGPVTRRRAPYRTRRGVRPPDSPVTPYAELHCHSNFSFLDGASGPDRLVEQAVAAGPARRWRSPTTTGSPGHRCSPRSPRSTAKTSGSAQDRLRRRAVPRAVRTAERRTRPGRSAPARPRRGRRGLPPAGRGDHRRPAARGREGPAGLRPRGAGRAGAGDTGWRSPGAARGWCARALTAQAAGAAATELDRLTALFGHDRVVVELVDHGHAP